MVHHPRRIWSLGNKFGTKGLDEGIKCVKAFMDSVDLFAHGPFKTDHLKSKQTLHLNPKKPWQMLKKSMFYLSL